LTLVEPSTREYGEAKASVLRTNSAPMTAAASGRRDSNGDVTNSQPRNLHECGRRCERAWSPRTIAVVNDYNARAREPRQDRARRTALCRGDELHRNRGIDRSARSPSSPYPLTITPTATMTTATPPRTIRGLVTEPTVRTTRTGHRQNQPEGGQLSLSSCQSRGTAHRANDVTPVVSMSVDGGDVRLLEPSIARPRESRARRPGPTPRRRRS